MEKQCDKCMYEHVCRFKKLYLDYVDVVETSVREFEAGMDEEKCELAKEINAEIHIYCVVFRKYSKIVKEA